ncbi:transcriptional regulator, partial [Klebsiella pneumoniae]
MEFGMKRVLASVQAAATLNKLYDGSPVSLTAISNESKLSTSYLEQIFKKLRAGNLVISQRGPGG